ncbi:sporulation histidine kinase inhibitor Sda [Alkalibacillus haloalkaliphilus]|nr:sporulation histidine kinase inhibitor Sda [Alkalibacillus haloalkaliphilus]MDV2581773.1 sporulation histidine kinase inhibitor Sda [Alkalibacillus haloalkaliphilus]
MANLDDSTLINAYHEAVEINLSKDFINLLEKEITFRGFKLEDINPNQH